MASSNADPIGPLLNIMVQLRDQQHGCPWDQKQTFSSLTQHTIEEAYEVVDAIERQDYADLRSELGDLLFQIIFYAQLAKEQQLFDFHDICQYAADKLIHRHPHVFAGKTLDANKPFLQQWEENKRDERAAKDRNSLVDEIPQRLPALLRAEKIQQRCATVGFDWQELSAVLAKVQEELSEVQQALAEQPSQADKVLEEVGDLLFATVNVCRHLGQSAEQTLQQANNKFIRRFQAVERRLQQQNIALTAANLSAMEAAWQWVKQQEQATDKTE